MHLSNAQKEHFREHGYVVLEQAVSAEQLGAIHAAALAIVDKFDPRQHLHVFSTRDEDRGRDRYFSQSAQAVHCFFEEQAVDESGRLRQPKHLSVNKIGHALHDLEPAFGAFCRHPLFGSVLNDLGFAPAVLWQTMYIFKQPRIGGEVRWHQDGSYLIADYPGVLGMWVAVEDAHRGNGCLWVMPGGHRWPLREVFEWDHQSGCGSLRKLEDPPEPLTDSAKALEVPAGSVVVFDDRLPHYSSENRSHQSRHAFTLHFARQDSRWSPRNWLQRPDLAPFVVG